ncbi:MAG: hypothetical protein WD768_16945 [Phycisphaeraceae bacterium]
MSTHHRTAIIALLAVLFPTFAARSAISPDNVKRMKDNAKEVFVIEVTKIDVASKNLNTVEIIYTMKIIEVIRSGEGVKAGQTIKVESYDRFSIIPEAGPKIPERLKVGWKGTAYTRYDEKTKRFAIAVYGHSFEPAE